MSEANRLRNNLIDKLLAVENPRFLKALEEIIDSVLEGNDEVTLSKEQQEMLKMSEKDISKGNIISQESLDKQDLEWLKK